MGPGSAEQRCTLHRVRDTSLDCHPWATSVPTGMVSNPTAAPILFDRALLRARMERARRGGPVTFLLDRVREDMEERLQAVTRNFSDAAEIWTPGELLRKPLAERFRSIARIDVDR